MSYRYLAALLVSLVFIPKVVVADDETPTPEVQRTLQEKQASQQKLKDFYADKPGVMNQQLQKYQALSNLPLVLKQGDPAQAKINALNQGRVFDQALQQQAQAKQTERFQDYQCENFLSQKFSKLQNCKKDLEQFREAQKAEQQGKPVPQRAAVEANDRIQDLVATWIDEEELELNVNKMPIAGKTSMPIWSDDYWKIQWGITSYRYGQGDSYANYDEAIAAYQQPSEFRKLERSVGVAGLAEGVLGYSPAEKMDLTVGDADFTLTKQQKREGDSSRGDDRNVEPWMGICHGWAPAAMMLPKAVKPVFVQGYKKAKITWYPSDIRAMGSLLWANGSSETNFVGGRCNAKDPKEYANGRLIQQDCFDNNPATFHLALGNMVGIKKYSFVIDKTFDYEVWNQPVQSYEFEYHRPGDESVICKKNNLAKCMVNYDAAFKKKDRFQKPLTRGVCKRRSREKCDGADRDDSKIKKVIGVTATVVYGSEVGPNWGPQPSRDSFMRFESQYDLELDAAGKIIGGEWYDNNHVDFMWVPQKDSVARNASDRIDVGYKGALNEDVVAQGPRVSSQGAPLCEVVAHLVSKSSGKTYSCD